MPRASEAGRSDENDPTRELSGAECCIALSLYVRQSKPLLAEGAYRGSCGDCARALNCAGQLPRHPEAVVRVRKADCKSRPQSGSNNPHPRDGMWYHSGFNWRGPEPDDRPGEFFTLLSRAATMSKV
jgi:hypothetical protein